MTPVASHNPVPATAGVEFIDENGGVLECACESGNRRKLRICGRRSGSNVSEAARQEQIATQNYKTWSNRGNALMALDAVRARRLAFWDAML